MDRRLLLWGFMGVGKSTVGPLVAVASSLAFIDLDQVISAHAGCAIAQIFASEGEIGFRAREARALRSVLAGPAAVVALGGGALLDPTLRREARACARLVTLTARPSTLRERLVGDHGRPLFDARFKSRLAERAAAYADVDARVATDGLTPAAIRDRVLEAVA